MTTDDALQANANLARIAELQQALRKSQGRERVASAAYNGQQQSYRELETLYQAVRADAAVLQQRLEQLELHSDLLEIAAAQAHGAALLAELEAAREVVTIARRGFGTEEDIERAHAFDPNALTRAIRTYDAAVKARRE